MSYVRPKKSLGQHYLRDENIAGKIAGSLQAAGISHVVEIGAGTGILTRHLLQRSDISLTALEIDPGNVKLLREKFRAHCHQIMHQDALKFSFSKYGTDRIAIIGNFPYNITSPLLFRILDHRNTVHEVVCMLQKEVAERITAAPGSRVYGILSVLLQAYYDIEFLFPVSPGVFQPPPKVFSAVIRLTRNRIDQMDCDELLFRQVVKTCFNQRRKMIRNSIRNLCPVATSGHYLFGQRPEQLSAGQFVTLTNLVGELMGKKEK